MKIKFGAGSVKWDWQAHQLLLIPTIAILVIRHFYGYTRFGISISWLAWGAYVEVWKE